MLLAVHAVAEHRSFKRAGAELGITPSAVYKRVRAAGDLFGRSLFMKSERGVILTQIGRTLNGGAGQTLEQLLLTEDMTTAFMHMEDGRLLVGHSTYLPPRLLSLLLKTNVGEPESWHIEHTSGLTADLVRRVAEGSIHAGFGFLPIDHPALLVRQLYEEPLVVCMRKTHTLAVKAEIRPEDLTRERFIAVSRAPFPVLHQEIEDYFGQFGLTLNIVVDAFGPPEAQILVEQNVGICLLERSAVTSGALVGKSLSNRILTRKSGMFVREDNRHPTLLAFVHLVLAAVVTGESKAVRDRPGGR
ncbi:MAG TPA: LysR family transcriptional regulator [Acidisarcina sp.]